jgi:hypothetical protein
MAKVLNYPTKSSEGLERWRREAEEIDRAHKNREDRRRGGVQQARRDELNAWFAASFGAFFAQYTAEDSPFDKGWIAVIRGALDRVSQELVDRIVALEDRCTSQEAQLFEAKRETEIAKTRERAFEAWVKELEAELKELEAELKEQQAQARDTAARTNDEWRRGDVEAVKTEKAVAGLRVEIVDKIAALRERMVDAIESRPAFDPAHVDWVVEAAVARTRTEARVEFDGALESQRREFAAQIQALIERPVEALAGLERDRLSRVEGCIERMHEEFEARLADKERAFDAVAGLDRGRLSHIEKAVERIGEELRGEFGARLAEKERAVDALASRPTFDQSQVDRAVEATVARTRTEARVELDRALEAQRREFSAQFEGLKERLGEALAGPPAFDQTQINRSVETAVKAAVARTRIEMRAEFDRALEARLEEKGLAFKERDAEFERRAEIAEQRARALEAAIAELRQQIRDDAIRVADDLRARTRDASLAATTGLRSELESNFAARLAETEKRAERAEEGARALEMAMVELRDAVRDDVATASGDLRQQAHDSAVATVVELRTEIEAKIAAVAERQGKLSIAKTYEPGAVVYRGDLVVHNGGTWHAKCDSAQMAGGSEYVCLARAGRDGADGRSLSLRGPYDMHAKYTNLDIVEYGGELFVALRDDPALCPGEGWQLLAPRGKTGEKGASGPRGQKGDPGPSGAKIHSWQLDREGYHVSPLMEDGTVGPILELRGLFEQYLIETSD